MTSAESNVMWEYKVHCNVFNLEGKEKKISEIIFDQVCPKCSNSFFFSELFL